MPTIHNILDMTVVLTLEASKGECHRHFFGGRDLHRPQNVKGLNSYDMVCYLCRFIHLN